MIHLPIHIAIDGPVGAGKSDIARRLAKRLGFLYLYTGAMYRAVAYFCSERHLRPDNTAEVTAFLSDLSISLSVCPCGKYPVQVIVNGSDITDAVFSPEVDRIVPYYAKIQEVRKDLVQRQQDMAKSKDVVMEGRDIGLRVLPKAQLKIYLTASVEERARRQQELFRKNGRIMSFEEALRDTRERDFLDMNRSVDPLRKLPDAWELDTTGLVQEQVVDRILTKMKEMRLI